MFTPTPVAAFWIRRINKAVGCSLYLAANVLPFLSRGYYYYKTVLVTERMVLSIFRQEDLMLLLNGFCFVF